MAAIYYFAIVGATDNPIYETDIIPSSRSSSLLEHNKVNDTASRTCPTPELNHSRHTSVMTISISTNLLHMRHSMW